MLTRPMLAARLKSIDDLRFPCLATPKLDGIRCLVLDGVAYSRAFKPIRNSKVQEALSALPHGLDGELMAPDGSFQDTTSTIMSYDGGADFEYHVFDLYNDSEDYAARATALANLELPSFCRKVLPHQLDDRDAFDRYMDACLSAEYEGVITRRADSPYKCGRSSKGEQYMVKHKEYKDSEAVVIGFVEANVNLNPIVPNAFGLAKRPGGRSGKAPKGTLGAFVVRDLRSGVVFEIGTGKGLTTHLRQVIWDNQPNYMGSILRYTFQSQGVKDKPRFPSFIGFRHVEDL